MVTPFAVQPIPQAFGSALCNDQFQVERVQGSMKAAPCCMRLSNFGMRLVTHQIPGQQLESASFSQFLSWMLFTTPGTKSALVKSERKTLSTVAMGMTVKQGMPGTSTHPAIRVLASEADCGALHPKRHPKPPTHRFNELASVAVDVLTFWNQMFRAMSLAITFKAIASGWSVLHAILSRQISAKTLAKQARHVFWRLQLTSCDVLMGSCMWDCNIKFYGMECSSRGRFIYRARTKKKNQMKSSDSARTKKQQRHQILLSSSMHSCNKTVIELDV
jgi:hypothetical protein